jgi:citrate lyase subunit beta/citryl-CoA lyase
MGSRSSTASISICLINEGFAFACRQGRELGFDGKTLIHPKQIAPANAAYAPSPEEIEYSRRVIAAHAEGAAAGKGVVLVDGKLVEGLHVENARRLLAVAGEIDRITSVDTPQHPV